MARGDLLIKKDARVIAQNDANNRKSRSQVSKLHKQYMKIYPERSDVAAAAAARVDERNLGLDCLVQAEVVVCQKFKRFKTTKQCKHIKSRPDVKEPGFSQPQISHIEVDKVRTERYEARHADAFATLLKTDAAKVGSKNPESLPTLPKKGDEMKGQTGLQSKENKIVTSTKQLKEMKAKTAAKAASAKKPTKLKESKSGHRRAASPEKEPAKKLPPLPKAGGVVKHPPNPNPVDPKTKKYDPKDPKHHDPVSGPRPGDPNSYPGTKMSSAAIDEEMMRLAGPDSESTLGESLTTTEHPSALGEEEQRGLQELESLTKRVESIPRHLHHIIP